MMPLYGGFAHGNVATGIDPSTRCRRATRRRPGDSPTGPWALSITKPFRSFSMVALSRGLHSGTCRPEGYSMRDIRPRTGRAIHMHRNKDVSFEDRYARHLFGAEIQSSRGGERPVQRH